MTMSERLPLIDALNNVRRLGGGLTAVANEIAAMLERLATTGEDDAIDVRSLPLSDGERDRLLEWLGEGEATIELQLNGLTRCVETAVPAVWWVRHYYPDYPEDRIAAEFIEVAEVPRILEYEAGEIEKGVVALRKRIERGSDGEESNHE